MKTRHLKCSALALATFVAAVRADDGWTRLSTDFASTAVSLTAVNNDGITVGKTEGGAQTVSWATTVRLSRGTRPATPSGLVLCTADGQRLVGTPVKIDGANLVWRTERNAELAVPIESVLAVLRDKTAAAGLAEARAEDVAQLSTGDAVKGILTDAAGDAFTFAPATGDPVKVPPGSVAAIYFASPPGGRKAVAPPPFLVRVGASLIACASVTSSDNTLKLKTTGGQEIAAAWPDVQAIEHTGGPVAWLSGRVPTESIQTPYLDGDQPARMDATVTGEPIRFGGVAYDRGIGVHSRSKLVFAVEPGDKSFRTRYAIDGPMTRADVDVRVSIDGKVVHEQKAFKAGTLSPVIEADLAGAKAITLEVDYGRGYDVQDRLNWIEPAIIR